MTDKEARSAVMGAISIALKDPTLQRGFEIICKENAELREELNYANSHCLFHSDCPTQKEKTELNVEVRELKLLVSSLVYEINQIWDINEMNDDLRRQAEKVDREVQLSKMTEDNRMVISALGFAVVPPKPKLDVKEV